MNPVIKSLPRWPRATARCTSSPSSYLAFHPKISPRIVLSNFASSAKPVQGRSPAVGNHKRSTIHHGTRPRKSRNDAAPEIIHSERDLENGRKRVGRQAEVRYQYDQLQCDPKWRAKVRDEGIDNKGEWVRANKLARDAEVELGGFEMLMTARYGENWVEIVEKMRLEAYEERNRKFESKMKEQFGDEWKEHDKRRKRWFNA